MQYKFEHAIRVDTKILFRISRKTKYEVEYNKLHERLRSEDVFVLRGFAIATREGDNVKRK